MKEKYRFGVDFGEQILRCSVCGFCQAVCPIYGLTHRPALNARGKMLLLQEILKGQMELDEDLIETLFQCTGCASCADNCPAGVEVPEILRHVRQEMVDMGTCHPAFSGMNDVLLTKANIYAESDSPDYVEGRKVDQPAEHVYFAGCVGAYREEEATAATLDLLDRLEVDYTLIDEICCTGILEDVGYAIHTAKADAIIDRVKATGAKTLITACPYCYRTFRDKVQYKGLLESGIEIVHITQFLKACDFGVTTDLVVTYHDPCDLGRHGGIYDEPRATIRKIAKNFVEMEHHQAQSLCCGAGGGVRGSYPANSIGMARRRLAEAEAIGADVVLTECNSCVHNLSNAKLRRQKMKIFTTPQFIGHLLNLS